MKRLRTVRKPSRRKPNAEESRPDPKGAYQSLIAL